VPLTISVKVVRVAGAPTVNVTVRTCVPAGVALQLYTAIVSETCPLEVSVKFSWLVPDDVNWATGPPRGLPSYGLIVTVTGPAKELMLVTVRIVRLVIVRIDPSGENG